MKNGLMTAVVAFSMLAAVPAGAVIDVGAYGGLGWGTVKDRGTGTSSGMDGDQYGAFAHITLGLQTLFLGGGAFYHAGSYPSDSPSGKDFSVETGGIELIVSLGFKVFPASPFARAGISISDRFTLGDAEKETVFATTLLGGGLSFRPFKYLSIFAEYLRVSHGYRRSSPEITVVNNSVNLGVRLNI